MHFTILKLSQYHHIFNKVTNHLLWILHLAPSDHVSILDVGLPQVLVQGLEEPRNGLGTHLPTSSQNLQRVWPGLAAAQPQHAGQLGPRRPGAGDVTPVQRPRTVQYITARYCAVQ